MEETASKGNGAPPLDLSQEEQAAQPWWPALGARDRGQLPGGRRGSRAQGGGGMEGWGAGAGPQLPDTLSLSSGPPPWKSWKPNWDSMLGA